MSDPTTQVEGVQWGVVLPALLLFLVGACAYAGVAKPFWRSVWPRPTLGFGIPWIGLSGLVSGFGSPTFGSPWGVLVALVAVVCFAIGLLSFFWMATRLQPSWYRAPRATGRPRGWQRWARPRLREPEAEAQEGGARPHG